MKTTYLLLLLSFFLKAEAKNYYFSTSTGNDSRSMDEAQNSATPWKTITKLNAFFKSLDAGDTVFFKRGDVFFGSIQITKSGNLNQPIVLGAYGNGVKPEITGFQTIKSWAYVGDGKYETLIDWSKENDIIYSNGVNNNTLNMVIFDGALQAIGRYPKANLGNESYFTIEAHVTNKLISTSKIAFIPNFEGGELVQRKLQWIFDRSIVKSQNSNTITTDPLLSPDHPNVTYNSIDGHGFFFQNHINTLTTLGEWCYNKETGKMTMYFGYNHPESYKVEVSTIKNLITINDREYITIQDIQFRGSNENIAAISASRFCKINKVDFLFAGVNAIDVDRVYYSQTNHNEITNCFFNYTNNNALNLVESTEWNISNNLITNTGIIAGMGQSGDGQYVAIFKAGSNSLIEYNKIDNIGYSGIWFTGNNVIVRYNEISNFSKIKSDGGGIYTFGATGIDRLIYKNIIHDGKGDQYGLNVDLNNPYAGQVHGIYMDSQTSNVTISENTSFNNSHAGLFMGGNQNITVTGNTFYNNKVTQIKGNDNSSLVNNITLKHNVLFAISPEQLVLSILLSSNYYSSIGFINENYYCRPTSETQGIITSGYPNSPSLKNYPGGGIIEANNAFYSLDTWQSFSGHDVNTKETPLIPLDSSSRFEYNATHDNKTISLDGVYHDAKNNVVSGSITLPPYSSIVLLKEFTQRKTDVGYSNGLTYKYYEGDWNALPDFEALTPVKTGSTPNIDINIRNAGVNEHFAFVWEGYINIPTPGTYTFETVSDDGSKFYFNSFYVSKKNALVNNDNLHAPLSAKGTVNINTAGLYPIAATFFEKDGGETMQLYWTGPNFERQLIPDAAFEELPSQTNSSKILSYNQSARIPEDITEANIEINKFYPNPFKESLIIDFYNSIAGNDINIDIRDLNGRTIYTYHAGKILQGNNQIKLNLSGNHLHHGMYIATISVNGASFKTVKLIKK